MAKLTVEFYFRVQRKSRSVDARHRSSRRRSRSCPPIHIHQRPSGASSRYQEFEVGEMSMSSYLIARERGFDMIALPVFPSRRLVPHRAFLQHRLRHQAARAISSANASASANTNRQRRYGSGVSSTTTSACRNTKSTGTWSAPRAMSHGGVTGFTPPAGISFQRIPPDKSMASMLVNNELDAAAINSPWKNAPTVIGRSHRIPGVGRRLE